MRFQLSYRVSPTGPRRWSVVWEDGRIEGHAASLAYIRALVKQLGDEPFALSPSGPWYSGNPIDDPLAFLVFCQNLLSGVRVTGDVPMLSPVPSHLIA